MDIATAIRRLQLHTAYLDEDVGQLTELLDGLVQGLGDDERRSVLRHAYWRMPDVPTGVLLAVTGGEGPLRAVAGRGPVVGSCPTCSRVVRARSRDDLDIPADRPCATCRARPPATTAIADRPGFTWEFGGSPQPWHVAPVEQVAPGDRRWAEHYTGPARPIAPQT